MAQAVVQASIFNVLNEHNDKTHPIPPKSSKSTPSLPQHQTTLASRIPRYLFNSCLRNIHAV
jgi:hypothetical protein